MRDLTSKQKKHLIRWQDEAGKTIQGTWAINSWGDLSLAQMEELESINNTEILPQEVDRFFDDRIQDKLNEVEI